MLQSTMYSKYNNFSVLFSARIFNPNPIHPSVLLLVGDFIHQERARATIITDNDCPSGL